MSSKNIHSEKILILDFGSQVTQLIARRVREIGVYCEIYPFDADLSLIKDFNAQGIILSGGPESTTEQGSPRAPAWVFEAGVPVLGICYGLQTMSVQLGGTVQGSSKREYGHATVDIKAACPLFDGLTDHEGETKLDVWMSHGDKVTKIPEGFITVGSTETCPYAAIYNEQKQFYGVQFHPEVTHSKQGGEILKRFVLNICGLHGLWSPSAIIDDAIERIRAQVGDKKVLLGLSGGVDSSVTALLLQKAIGKQLTCVFVDNGLLRLNEGAQVEAMFKPMDLNFVYADASDKFLEALKGISDPELKRKAIGKTFIDVFADEARKLEGVDFLAQEENLARAFSYYAKGAILGSADCYERMYEMVVAEEIEGNYSQDFADNCVLEATRLGSQDMMRQVVAIYKAGRLTDFAAEIEQYYLPVVEAMDDDDMPDDDGRYDAYA